MTSPKSVAYDDGSGNTGKILAAERAREAAIQSLGQLSSVTYLPALVEIVYDRDQLIESFVPNPKFNAQAQREEREQFAAQTRADASAKIAALVEKVQAEADATRRRAAHLRLLDTTDAAVLLRSEQSWRLVVEPRLDQGLTIFQALSTADLDATAGAQRFASTWLELHDRPDLVDLEIAVAARWATLVEEAGNPTDAATIRAAALAGPDVGTFRQVAATLDHGSAASTALVASRAYGGYGTELEFAYAGTTLLRIAEKGTAAAEAAQGQRLQATPPPPATPAARPTYRL